MGRAARPARDLPRSAGLTADVRSGCSRPSFAGRDSGADLLAGAAAPVRSWEQFASLLTEGLVRRGVDVTLFATADSVTTARLVGTAPTGYSENPALDAKVWEALHISAVFEHAGKFDLIHNSFDFLPLTYSGLVDTPVVTTIHGFSSAQIVPVFEKYNERGYYVAISDAAGTTVSTTSPRSTTASTSANSICSGHRATTSCSSGGFIRTKAWWRRSTSPSAPHCRS